LSSAVSSASVFSDSSPEASLELSLSESESSSDDALLSFNCSLSSVLSSSVLSSSVSLVSGSPNYIIQLLNMEYCKDVFC